VKLEITPQPSEAERAAIVAALALDAEPALPAWPKTVLPGQDDPVEP
jgi:hypothetical protein